MKTMASKKRNLKSTPSPDMALKLSGGTMNNPDVTLYERGNLFISADGNSKMIFRGNTIECYGVGGGKSETGSFTTPTDPNTLVVPFTKLTEKPDVIIVTIHMNENDDSYAFYINNRSYWDLRPWEDNLYRIEIDSESGETGIVSVSDSGFTFRTNGDNTKGLNADFIAVKWS